MEILIPSLISALALGAFCCPALARPVDYLLSGGTITTITTFDLTAVPDWWLSGGFAAHPAGTAATLALLFLISLLFFSMEQAKGCGEDGDVLGSARIKTGTELVRGSVTWDGKASPKARGFAYGFTKGKYLFEPERHVLLDGSTGSGKTRFCLIPTIDLLTYGDGANGSEPVSIAMALFPEERGQGSSHWTESARSGCSALILLIACSEECPAGAKHLATVNEVLCRGTEGEGADPTAPLKALLRQLPDEHPARSRASQLLSSGGNELRSVDVQ